MSHYLHKIFTLSVFDTVQGCIYNIYKASGTKNIMSIYKFQCRLPTLKCKGF
jgi:hypothetical protein